MALVIWYPMIKNATNYAYGDNETISSNIQTVNDGRVYQKTISASGSKTLTCSELNSNGLTMSFWVKKPASGEVEIFKTSCSNSDTTYPFVVKVSNQLVSANCDYFGYLSTNLSDGWNHVVIRLGYYFELYVNDQLNRHEKTDPNRLYYFNNQYTVNFTGLLIQDFKVYNHYFSDFELDYHKREPMVKYKFDGSTLNYMIPHFNIRYPQEYLLSEDTAIGSCSAVLSRNKFIPEELPKYDLYTIIMWLKANSNIVQIKANNILKTFNSVGTGNINGHMTANREGYFYYNAGVDKLRKFNILAHHKYFLCSKTEYQLDSFVIMDGSDWYMPLINSSTPIYMDGRSFVVISGEDNDISNCGLLIWCKHHDSWKAYDCIIIDLTEIGLDNLTAQEFYDKYKEYLPSIAAGEEVTIDKVPVPTHRLPDEYQEVEYIQSSGTQYINTDVLPSANITFDFSIKQTADMKSKVFGSRGTSYTDRALAIYFNGNNVLQLNYDNSLWSATESLDNKIVNVRTEKTSSNYNWYVNGVKVWNPSIYTGEYFNGNIFFGSYNSNGNPAVSGSNGTQTLYYCKIFDNNSLIRNLVPCYRKSDNKPGLYDLVEGIFYTNQGTSEFLVGNPVNNISRLDLVTYNGYKIKLNESIPTDKWVMLSIEHNQSGFSGKVDNQSIDIEAEETDYSDSIGGFNGNIADFRLIPNINLDLTMLFENRAIIDDLGNIYIHKIKCNGVYDISLWNDGYVNENGDITTNDDYPNASYTDLFRVSKEKVYIFNNINNSVRIFEYDEYNNFIDEYSGYSSGRYSTVDDKLIRVMILDGSTNNKNSFYFYDEDDEFASNPSLVDNKGQLQANDVGEYQQQKAEAEIYKSRIIGNKIYED